MRQNHIARSRKWWRQLWPAVGAVCLTTGAASPLWAAQAFQESSGQVVMEAERYAQKMPRNGQDWVQKTTKSGYSAGGYMEALPDSGISQNADYNTLSPELLYNVQFATPGTYYVWVRASGPNGNGDTLHTGVDGTTPASADRIGGYPTSWAWKRDTMDGVPATLQISAPGLHTIHLWMREDGVQVDKFLLRTSTSSSAPSGAGPAESPLVTVITDATPPTGTVTINAGAAATNTPNVTLTLSASDAGGVTQMCASNVNANCTGSAVAYATTLPWTLSAGEGMKSVYVQYKDSAGNWSSAGAISDSIELDTTPPAISIMDPTEGQIIVAPNM